MAIKIPIHIESLSVFPDGHGWVHAQTAPSENFYMSFLLGAEEIHALMRSGNPLELTLGLAGSEAIPVDAQRRIDEMQTKYAMMGEALAGVRESSLKKDEEIARLRDLLAQDCLPDCELTGAPHPYCVQRKEQPRDLASPESLPEPRCGVCGHPDRAHLSKIGECCQEGCLCMKFVAESLPAMDAACVCGHGRGSHWARKMPFGCGVRAEECGVDHCQCPLFAESLPEKEPSPIAAANNALAEMSDAIAAQEWPSPSSTTAEAPERRGFESVAIHEERRKDHLPEKPASGRILAKNPRCEGVNSAARAPCESAGIVQVPNSVSGDLHWYCGRHNPNKPPRAKKESPSA